MNDAFEKKHGASRVLAERAKGILAGGLSGELRAASPFPVFIDRAEGSRKWDADGNEFIDYSMGSAALMLGHAHPAVVEAVRAQVGRGTLFSALTELELEWAELIRSLYPSAGRVRFVGTGTEAIILALRLARAATGKPKVLRFEGHFHGWGEDMAVGVKPPFDRPVSHGLPTGPAGAAGPAGSVVVAEAGMTQVEEILSSDQEIGSVILEPSGASWGTVPLPGGFLKDLREATERHGALLIFDEVITGFRWSPGGVQALSGVTPDLTTLAKNVTGGLPGGAVAGREDLMRLLDPAVEFRGIRAGVFHRGTFNANPLSAASGIAALNLLKTGEPQRRADEMAEKLRRGMQAVLRKHEIAGAVYGESSTFHVFLGAGAKGGIAGLTAGELKGIPPGRVAAFQTALRQRGVDPLSYTGGVTSSAHTPEDIEETLSRFDEAMAELAEEGLIERL